MIFNEALYPVFLALAVGAFHLLPKSLRPWWIFLTGVAFYAYYANVFILLLVLEIGVVYLLGKQCHSSRAAFLGALGVAVGVLLYYKYSHMAAVSLSQALHMFGRGGLPSFEVLFLPLAISFFTFEFVHYIVDSRQGKIPEHSLQDFLAFAMFFPTMVAGPIKRFQDFAPKLRDAAFSYDDMSAGGTRILIGLAKKVVIADTMDLWVQPLKSAAGVSAASPQVLWLGLLAYSVKIYLDFSGYSDIAIGSARLFGIAVPENFSWPYLRTNIAAFWRHWHMSLTSWITDYIYIPLGGSRRRLPRVAVNTMLAMGASGLWHGADWHFVAWGLYHGLLLVAYRLYRQVVRPAAGGLAVAQAAVVRRAGQTLRPLGLAMSALFTFVLVTVGWGLFILPVGQFVRMTAKLLSGY